MNKFIGIDIGGTNIRVALVNEDYEIECMNKDNTLKGVDSTDDLYQKISNLIKSIPNYNEAVAIGIGIPGAVDLNGELLTARNAKILLKLDLKTRLYNEFKKQIYIENDAKVAALAESIEGAGKDSKIVQYVTISTGVGGGIVIDKKLYQGSSNIAGYLGRMIVNGTDQADKCMSGTALLNKAKEEIDNSIEKTEKLFELARNKNEIANKIVEEFKKNLTTLLLNISITVNPDIIVLGGGIINERDVYLNDVIETYHERAHILAKDVNIKIAELEEPGVIGAAIYASKM